MSCLSILLGFFIDLLFCFFFFFVFLILFFKGVGWDTEDAEDGLVGVTHNDELALGLLLKDANEEPNNGPHTLFR
eukprot:scaffold77701_cov49-Attheya_sp.AAC.5